MRPKLQRARGSRQGNLRSGSETNPRAFPAETPADVTTTPSRASPLAASPTRSFGNPVALESPPIVRGARSSSAARTSPRTCRSDPSNLSDLDRRRVDGRPARPALAKTHHERIGHDPHRGAGEHTSRPRSMSAWFHSAGRRGSSQASAASRSSRTGTSSGSAPRSTRAHTRRAFVSTAATGTPYAMLATAADVYSPTPGRARRATGSRGTTPRCRSAISPAARCSATARRG